MTRKLSTYEHELEDWACTRFATAGHVCLKFISPGFPGVPDRVLLTAGGKVAFLEFKAPMMKPRRAQPAVLAMLRKLGFRAEVIDTRSQVERLLQEYAV